MRFMLSGRFAVLGLGMLAWAGTALADASSAVATVRTLPGVVSANEDGGGNMWVAVQNRSGAQWNAYAVGVCKMVRPHRARVFMVKVVDFTTIRPKSKPKDWLLLGSANCGDVPSDPAPQQSGGQDQSAQ